jgi:hypothetical protein
VGLCPVTIVRLKRTFWHFSPSYLF